jgi:hypothetical protein
LVEVGVVVLVDVVVLVLVEVLVLLDVVVLVDVSVVVEVVVEVLVVVGAVDVDVVVVDVELEPEVVVEVVYTSARAEPSLPDMEYPRPPIPANNPNMASVVIATTSRRLTALPPRRSSVERALRIA